jgi:hypothetical protein
MDKPEIISVWDLPDTKSVPDGYDNKTVADLSARNVQYMIEQHNKLAWTVLELADRAGIKFDDPPKDAWED